MKPNRRIDYDGTKLNNYLKRLHIRNKRFMERGGNINMPGMSNEQKHFN